LTLHTKYSKNDELNKQESAVVFVSAERVRKLPVSLTGALKILRMLRRGSDAILVGSPRAAVSR
jgi:hypothetical protein